MKTRTMHIAAATLRAKHNTKVTYSRTYMAFVDFRGDILGSSFSSADRMLTENKAARLAGFVRA